MKFSGLSDYFSDIWNFSDILGNIFVIGTFIAIWGDGGEDARDWLLSLSLFFGFFKWISFFRVIRQTRRFIRTVIEIFKDIQNFLYILGFIIFGFSLIFN
mmetsp:Transcript_22868/g.19866  ORF Transcript_22868/g.19866 Transcript_22868/m.19866 type:complete len:100 (+) Transcript_22868:1538-1837(+)